MNNLINLNAEELAEEFCDISIIEQLKDCKVLAAECIGEGPTFVLFESKGVLYEVNGSHCSWFGLKEQWEPIVTTWKALKMRRFHRFYSEFEKELLEMIDSHLN